jgi:hypothetical protein
VEGVVPPEFVNPPPPSPLPPFSPYNNAYAFGVATDYTTSIGLGDAGGTAYNYRWRSYYGVRFVDWVGSSIQADIDPISTGGGANLIYNYGGTFDKTGVATDGSFVRDPTINYVSVGGRPFIYYQDTPVPAINDRAAIVTLPSS